MNFNLGDDQKWGKNHSKDYSVIGESYGDIEVDFGL